MTVVFLDPPCDPWAREGFENFTRGLPPEVEILIPEGATLALRLNTGMEEAREEQVVFFRGSGYPFAHCIDAVRKKQESGFWDVLSAPIDLVDSGDQFVRQIPPGLGSLSRILFEEVPPPGSHGLCLTKTAFRKVGPFRGLLDEATVLDWSLRAEALGCSLGEIEKPVAVLRAEGPMGGTGASDRVATVLGLLESFQTPGNLSAIRATLAGTFDVAGLLALRSQWNGEGETGGVIPALIDDRILELDPSLWRSLWTEARPIPGIGNSPHLDSRNKGGRRTTGELRRTSDPYPLVSVITPTYNAEKYLGRCLLSVFNQTYPNIEILVIDGGSTDNTVSMLKEWESRIDFWKTEKDAGVYEAMNKGLALAAGEIIVIRNADDYFAPTAVERAVRCLRSGHADYTLGGCVFVDSEESTVSRKMPSTIDASSLFNYSTASHQSIFAERKVYSLIGDYDTSYTIAADYKFRKLLMYSGLS